MGKDDLYKKKFLILQDLSNAIAASHNISEIVDLLLASKAAIDVPNHIGRNALMLACIRGHSGVVHKLLDAGANVDARTPQGDTPLILASLDNQTDVVRVLLDFNLRSALHFVSLRSAPNAHFSMRRLAQREPGEELRVLAADALRPLAVAGEKLGKKLHRASSRRLVSRKMVSGARTQ